MSDDIKLDQDEGKNPDENKQLESRRRFAKSGIAGGAVLMTLLSRPALGKRGGNDVQCTASVLASIDAGTSLHDFDPRDCRFGCTPGFWSPTQPSDAQAWQWIKDYTIVNGWDDDFTQIFGCGPAPTQELIDLYFPNGTSLAAILAIPNGDGPAFVKQSARHAIAAWLNASILGVFYASSAEYSPDQIVAKYCNAYAMWDPSNSDTTQYLDAVHQEFASLNEWRDCPLSADPDNYFYQPPIY